MSEESESQDHVDQEATVENARNKERVEYNSTRDLVVNLENHPSIRGDAHSHAEYHSAGNLIINQGLGNDTTARFESAITGAEQLLKVVDRAVLLSGLLRSVQVAGAVVGASVTIAAVVTPGLQWVISLALVGVALMVVPMLMESLILSSLREQIRRDQVAIAETVNELRELLGSVAIEEGWSRSTYRLMRVRIERFPL